MITFPRKEPYWTTSNYIGKVDYNGDSYTFWITEEKENFPTGENDTNYRIEWHLKRSIVPKKVKVMEDQIIENFKTFKNGKQS